MSETAQQWEKIRIHLQNHDLRFDEISNQLQQHDRRFDAVEKRIDKLECRIDSRFEALETRMDQKIGGLGIQIENVQSTVQLLAEQMSGFFRANADVRGRVECLEEKQQMTELRLKALERRRKRPGL